MSSSKKPSLVVSLLSNKCPKCREGDVFINKSIFPLGKCLGIHERCGVCGYKLKNERNNGAGINYALTVMLFFLNLLWYWPIFGITYKDYSIYYYLITSTVVVILLQPLLMRLARMLYIYLFAGFGEN